MITDAALCRGTGLLAAVSAGLEGGVRTVQYRDKGHDAERRLAEARALKGICAKAGVRFLINDDPALAAACGADGVHVGREDADPAELRRQYGPDLMIGVSCYDSLELARAAVASGADYVAFGSAFASPTKPGAVRAPLSLYRDAVGALPVPVVAIGGITAANGRPLVEVGCQALAVISAVLDAPDPRGAAAGIAGLFADLP